MSPDSESNRMMSVNDPAHDYELHNVGEGVQNIKFIKKEPVEEGSTDLRTVHDGTTTEAVLQVVKNRLEVLYEALPDGFTQEAINNIDAALQNLSSRNTDRDERGVRGTNKE